MQTPEAQSPPFTQERAASQPGHTPPPQSTSVSLPFFVVSVQDGARQVKSWQTKLLQSDETTQACDGAQGEHVAPPQSTSVSLPLW